MSFKKLPISKSISHYNKSGKALKYNVLKHSMQQFGEFTNSFGLGRIVTIIGVWYLSGALLALITSIALFGLKELQGRVLARLKQEIENENADFAKIENELILQTIFRFAIIGIIYTCFSISKNAYSDYVGVLYLSAHIMIFIAQSAATPKIMVNGIRTISVFLVAVAILTNIENGSILNALFPAFLAGFYGYVIAIIADLIALQYLRYAETQIILEENIASLSKNYRTIAEEALQKEMIEFAAGVGTYKWDFKSNSHYWSQGTFAVLGRDKEKGIPTADGFLNRLPEHDREEYTRISRLAKETGKPFDIEFSSLGDDGKYRHISFHGEITLGEDNKPNGMVGIVVDQTKTKESLEAANQAKNMLHMALISSNSMVVERDYANGKMRAFGSLEGVETQFSGLLDRFVDDELEAYILQGLGDESSDIINDLIIQAEKERKITSGLVKARLLSGKIIDARVNVYTEGEPSKNNGRLICIASDVTKEIARQKELMASFIAETKTKKLLQMALHEGKYAVIVTEADGSCSEAYGAFEIFGLKEKPELNSIFNTIMPNVPNNDKIIIKNAIAKARLTGQNQTIEHSILDEDNNKIMLRVTFARLMTGKKEKIISITSDITMEIKRRDELEKALEASNRANRAKSEFLANMSHEIRTPLNGVIAIAGLLSKTNLDHKQKEMVELVENSGETLKCLLNDILDLARVESGKLEIEETNFNLRDALHSVSSLFAFKAEEKGLGFNCNISEDLNNEFLGDPTRIKQIISNFLSNATKFTKSGHVSISAKLAAKSMGRSTCIIEVEDTGMGISKADIASLFERFEQIDGSITREHGGSGLGLSISKALAKLMKGDIKVTSKIGKGSKFALKIRLKDGEAKSQTTNLIIDENDKFDNPQSLKILAADDNPTNRRILELVLSPLGIDLTLCENGEEAISSFNSKEFDLILMDLQMPVLDGLSAITKIREIENKNQKPRIPIIAISANAMAHQIEEAINAGADKHIAKPYSPEGLISGVEEALENAALGANSKAA